MALEQNQFDHQKQTSIRIQSNQSSIILVVPQIHWFHKEYMCFCFCCCSLWQLVSISIIGLNRYSVRIFVGTSLYYECFSITCTSISMYFQHFYLCDVLLSILTSYEKLTNFLQWNQNLKISKSHFGLHWKE